MNSIKPSFYKYMMEMKASFADIEKIEESYLFNFDVSLSSFVK